MHKKPLQWWHWQSRFNECARFGLIVPHDARENQEVLQGCCCVVFLCVFSSMNFIAHFSKDAAVGNLLFWCRHQHSHFRVSGGRLSLDGSVDPCFSRQEQNQQRNTCVDALTTTMQWLPSWRSAELMDMMGCLRSDAFCRCVESLGAASSASQEVRSSVTLA